MRYGFSIGSTYGKQILLLNEQRHRAILHGDHFENLDRNPTVGVRRTASTHDFDIITEFLMRITTFQVQLKHRMTGNESP